MSYGLQEGLGDCLFLDRQEEKAIASTLVKAFQGLQEGLENCVFFDGQGEKAIASTLAKAFQGFQEVLEHRIFFGRQGEKASQARLPRLSKAFILNSPNAFSICLRGKRQANRKNKSTASDSEGAKGRQKHIFRDLRKQRFPSA